MTILLPKLEYAPAIWQPHQKALTDLIESLPNRTAHFNLSDYSPLSRITSMKSVLNLPLLSP